MRSVVVVLPASMWAMMPMLRVLRRSMDALRVLRGSACDHIRKTVGFSRRGGSAAPPNLRPGHNSHGLSASCL